MHALARSTLAAHLFAAAALAAPLPAGAAEGRREVSSVRTLSTEQAREAAEAAFEACTRQGHRVTVSVVGRDGALLALVRDERASTASVDSATGKAYASVSFRAPSGNLGEAARTNPGLLQMPRFVVLRGGLPIASGGEVVGAIGVGGAPGGDIDEACARVGLDRIGNTL